MFSTPNAPLKIREQKQILISLITALLLSLAGCADKSNRTTDTLRIGYQKWSTFSILKASGKLNEAFQSKGVKIEWIEFPRGHLYLRH